MLGLEKILNELIMILTLITMGFVFLYKYGYISKGLLIFMIILTIILYFCGRIVIDKNSKVTEKEKEDIMNIRKEVIDKKGKKKDGKKNSSNSR